MVKRIVCFGGGNAMTKAVLEPLKKYPLDISSVTSMTDDGGSTGQLRQDFGILPPGDIRRHILALSDAPQWKKDLWTFRFGHEVFACGKRGHNFANIFLAGLESSLKDYEKVLDIAHEFMEVKGRALPATLEHVQLCAELENGATIKGESEIDIPKKHNPAIKIKRLFLEPGAKAYSKTLLAVKKANAIIIGPGDLYSSSLPCFLPEGMRDAVKNSKAKKILVVNLMTKRGETDGFSVSDFAEEAEKYIGCALDFVIHNTEIPPKARIDENAKTDPLVIEPVKAGVYFDSKKSSRFAALILGQSVPKSLKSPRLFMTRSFSIANHEPYCNRKFIGKNVITAKGSIVHDPEKLGKLIYSLIQ